MKYIALVFALSLGAASGADLIVDWSIDFRNLKSPPSLHVLCHASKSTYVARGTPMDPKNGALYRYVLPAEVKGQCILSFNEGSDFEGVLEVNIKEGDEILHAKFPETSALFELSIRDDPWPDEIKRLYLFRLDKHGMPYPYWVYVTETQVTKGSAGKPRFFGMMHVLAGDYVAYINVPDGGDDSSKSYVYAKHFVITQQMLITHDQSKTVDDILGDARRIPIVFTAADSFDGPVAITRKISAKYRRVGVGVDGRISYVVETDADGNLVEQKTNSLEK